MKVRLFWVMSVLLVFAASDDALAVPDNIAMQGVVRDFVRETGRDVLGVGSWIRGSYGAGSDHDMRLVLPPGTPKDKAIAEWAKARQTLNRLIDARFKERAAAIKQATNLYPPSQMMGGVEDVEDAMARYRTANQVPNLGHAGAVTDHTPIRHAEGLYGSGSQGWIQGYESASGRLFYGGKGGKVFVGMADLTHLEEGLPRFDMHGMSNTSLQWAEHCADEVRAGRADKVVKYLKRLERDLAKARDLGRLGKGGPVQEEIRFLISELSHEPQKLSKLADRVDGLLWKSRVQANVLKAYSNVPEKARRVLSALFIDMKNDSLSRSMADFMRKAADKGITPERAIGGVVLALRVLSTAKAAGEEDRTAILTRLAPWLLDLGPQILAEMTQAIIDATKEAGYEFVASSQEAWDLLAGIYTVEGRDWVDFGREYTLEDLVRAIHDEQKLSNLIFAKAMLAAARDGGVALAAVDRKVAEAVWRRVYPVIADAWFYRLDELYAEYEDLAREFQTQPVLITYDPQPAALSGGMVNVTAEAASGDGRLGDRLKRMKEILGAISRKGGFVNASYTWNTGTEVDERKPWLRRLSLKGAGPHAVTVRLKLSAGSDEFGPQFPIKDRFTKLTLEAPGAVDVMADEVDVQAPSGPVTAHLTFGFQRRISPPVAFWVDGDRFALTGSYPDGEQGKVVDHAAQDRGATEFRFKLSRLSAACEPLVMGESAKDDCVRKKDDRERQEGALMKEEFGVSIECQGATPETRALDGPEFAFAIPPQTLEMLKKAKDGRLEHACRLYPKSASQWQIWDIRVDSQGQETRYEMQRPMDANGYLRIDLTARMGAGPTVAAPAKRDPAPASRPAPPAPKPSGRRTTGGQPATPPAAPPSSGGWAPIN